MNTLLYSLTGGTLIAAAAACLGTLMLSRRMALVAGPLGHLTLPGIALAMLWGFDISLGAFPFVVLGIVLIWLLGRRTRLPMEALTAVVFASGVAIAFLLLPLAEAEAALIGDIARLGAGSAIVCGIASVGILLILRRTYPQLVLGSISEDLAAAEGIAYRRYELLYLFLIAVIVALGVKVVGGLLTAALVAIPPAAARNLAGNLRQYVRVAIMIGMASAVTGILLSTASGLPAGPLVVLASALVFLCTLPFAR